MEVARALAFPGTGFVKSDQLFSLLLVWDGVDLLPGQARYEDDDSSEAEIVRRLSAEGLVCILPRSPGDEELPTTEKEAGERWQSIPWERIAAEHSDEGFVGRVAETVAERMVQHVFSRANEFLDIAAARGVAPVALDRLAMKATSLPVLDRDVPICEGALIQAASRCAKVDADCKVEDVLAFRDRNRPLMGRFRAALVDLSAAIGADSALVATQQADAVFLNRVEPALAKLEDALSESRLKFAWSMLLGASNVVLGGPIDPAVTAVGAGSVLTRNLRYAFDRDRLVRDHPFGLLHRAGAEFGGDEDRAGDPQITDPELEAKRWYQRWIENHVLAAAKARADHLASTEAPSGN